MDQIKKDFEKDVIVEKKLYEDLIIMISVSSPLIGQDELDAIKPVFESGWLGLGSNTYAFEKYRAKLY